jgi:zinc protease
MVKDFTACSILFAGTPDFINQDVKNILAVSTADVMQYTIHQNKPFVAASFVPKGQTNLIPTGSTKALVEEKIIEGKKTT